MEVRTAGVVSGELKSLGYQVIEKVGKTGVVGILKNGDGPVVMYRADMDCNSVAETVNLPFASKKKMKNEQCKEVPVMHACGHDAHVTWMLGIAKLMSDLKSKWKGTLVLVGHPAEETGFGAIAMANDSFHQTASSENGEGATLAMQKALQVANLAPTDIDYINAHGTATPNNDLSEGRALIRIFGENVPEFSSTKAFTGHTLAAAAAIEAVYSVLALQHNVIFPNLNFKNPMQEFNLMPQTTLKTKEIQHVLSNSFGFGGNCSTVIFSKN